MNIIFVTNEYETDHASPGGLATFTANMARLFFEQGNKVTVLLVTTKKQQENFQKEIRFENIFVDKKEWEILRDVADVYWPTDEVLSSRNRKEMVHLLKARMVKDRIFEINRVEKVDIVHFCNHGAFSLFMGNQIPYVIRVSGFMNIISGGGDTENGSVEFRDNPVSDIEKIDNKALRNAKNIVTPSNLLAGIVKENFNVISTVIESPFIIDKTRWDYSELDLLPTGKYVLFWGTMRFLKGIGVIAKVIKEYLSENNNIYFVMIGNDRKIKTMEFGEIQASEYVKLKAEKYKKNVLYRGEMPRNRLYPIIEAAEFCVLPSRIENLSNACIEAMAMGKIVIATKGASYEQIIDDRKSGFLCKRDDPRDFLCVMNEVSLLSSEEKKKIGENAKKRIEEMKPDKIYKRYESYYKDVIRGWKNE